jgi:hypothetical protein
MITVPAGLAARVPANAEPSDIDIETAATVVPAAALSGRDAAVGVKMTLVGVGAAGLRATTEMMKVAEALKLVFIPFARTCTDKKPDTTGPLQAVIRLLAEIAK